MSETLTFDDDWDTLVKTLSPPHQAFIDGAFVDAASSRTFPMVNPTTERSWLEIPACDAVDVDRAVKSARKAFEAGSWSQAAPAQRKLKLLRLAELMENKADALASLITLDMGKPISDARGEVAGSVRCLRWNAEAIDKIYGEVAPLAVSAMAYVTREPMGVVGAVVPWNYPVLMAMWKLGPALATGNSVILKPAEQSPTSALLLGQLASEADLPPGVLNVVPGLGEEAGRALGTHADVDKIAFTGSTEVGRRFMEYSASTNLKSITLELGGKSPAIILADTPDLAFAATMAAEGIFANAGQVCNAGSRLLVQRSVKDEFMERLAHASASWQPNNPLLPETKMGPLVNSVQFARVQSYVELGEEEGAVLSAGGHRPPELPAGYFIQPTIFVNVDNDMRIAREEIFGPVVVVIDFESEDDAIAIANDSEYGLAAGIWTSDVTKAHRLARRLRAGSVYVNCWDYGDNTLPFGGYKQSGFGRDKSLHALDHYTQLKSTYIYLG